MTATNNSKPMVSIVVPCRNERDHIETALKSILLQELPVGYFEVIVADGMSDDGTREIVREVANRDFRVRMVDNCGGIVSTGLNAAIREARGSIIVRMDAHTSYAPDYIRQCVEVLEKTAADNVGGPWIVQGKETIGKAIAAAFQSPFACGGARGHDPHYSGPVDTVYLGCWRREIFDRIGLFDEELVRNQDDELNLRLTRAGGKIWQSSKIKSWYMPRNSLVLLFRQYMQYGYWKVRVIQKHRMPASIRHVIPAFFVITLISLAAISFWFRFAAIMCRFLLATYAACLVIASFRVATTDGWKLLPFLPIVFICYHFGYGYGFLRGVYNFIILRRQPQPAYTSLTRPSTNQPPQQTARTS
jgi:succinoglycan biosynthesis protein ExoA